MSDMDEPLERPSERTIKDVSVGDRLIVLKWVLENLRGGDDPTCLLMGEIDKLENGKHVMVRREGKLVREPLVNPS